MTRQQALENNIAYWLEDQGFDDVMDAVMTACLWWADQHGQESGDEPLLPARTTPADWQQRVEALRSLQWMLKV